MWFCVSFFFLSLFFPLLLREEKKAYTRTRSSSCTSLRPFTTRFDEIDRRTTTRRSRCPVGGRRKRRKREEEERRKKKEEEEVVRKKIHELIDSKGFEPRSNKTPGRDFSRSWSTRIRCDKPTFRTPAALHFSPSRCVLFWFTRRFPGVFFFVTFF